MKNEFKVGDRVLVPEPQPNDLWSNGFMGRVTGIHRDGVVTIVDQDDDYWDVDAQRLTPISS